MSCEDSSLSLTDHSDRIFRSSVEAVQGEPLHHAELGSQRKATDSILGDLPVSCMNSFSHTDHSVSCMDLSLSREDASLSIEDPSLYCPDQYEDKCNQCNGPMPVHKLTRKRIERSSPIVSPLKSTRSPLPKVQRRHRTGTEYRQLQACTTTSEIPQPTQNSKAPSFTGITLQDFLMNDDERDALQDLNEELNTYMPHKHATYKSTVELPFLGMQDFFSLVRVTHTQKSNVVYLEVIDAVADSKDTVMTLLHDLQQQFIEGLGHKWLVVEGDGKLYEILKSLQLEYGDELSWVIPYPGDWHLLKNYQAALMKAYYDAGLKTLASVAGYPTASIHSTSQFKRTKSLAFIIN